MTVFTDSGGWLSVLLTSDQFHEAGKRYFQALRAARAVLLTTDFVLDEVITRIRYDAGHRKASEYLDLIHKSVDTRVLRIHRITESLWSKAEVIFLSYKEAKLSFTDCTSFALLQEQPVDEVFGYDAHFEMMGYILKPKPL
jgi:predicted nucleic acid-binding protein